MAAIQNANPTIYHVSETEDDITCTILDELDRELISNKEIYGNFTFYVDFSTRLFDLTELFSCILFRAYSSSQRPRASVDLGAA